MTVEKPGILIVDDEISILNSLRRTLEEVWDVSLANNALEARGILAALERDKWPAVVISDQRMPGENGSSFLAWVRTQSPDSARILLTGYSEFDAVVQAINEGGIYHFLNKPWEPAELERVLEQAAELWRLRQENARLHIELKARNLALERENLDLRGNAERSHDQFSEFIGMSPAMQKLKGRLGNLLGSDSTVLVLGESGTGKELVARALHFQGLRKKKSFIAQNCAALPESILESELFGHVKGAFTHAIENRPGILESANGGTLFLDEIGDMALSMQAKMLRFLQEGTYTPVGSRVEKRVDVRVIAATHRDLESMVGEGSFRQDLFYRLNVVPLRTPSLRERAEDITLLLEFFLQRKVAKMFGVKGKVRRIAYSKEAMQVLRAWSWPGNVRELENAVEYSLNMLGEENMIDITHLPDRVVASLPNIAVTSSGDPKSIQGQGIDSLWGMSLEDAMTALEFRFVTRSLEDSRGNISQAARILGLSRQGLHNKLDRHGLGAEEGKG